MILRTQETPCRMATWWLTTSEAADPELNKTLRASIRKYQKAGYMTATFRSGREDLEENTQKLMRHNFELQSKAVLAPIDGGEVFFVSNGIILFAFVGNSYIFPVAFLLIIRYNVAIENSQKEWQQ